MTMDHDALETAVKDKEITEYRTSKTQIKDYFGSSREAAQWGIDHGFFVNKKTGEPIKLESAMRRFQSRGGKSQGETSATYKEMGKTLPPLYQGMPQEYSVTVTVQQGQRDRTWKVDFRGADGYRFARNPSYLEFFKKRYGDKEGTRMFKMLNGDDSGGGIVISVS